MSNDLIEPGDIVNVSFGSSELLIYMKVLHVPVATGDSWHLRNTQTGTLIYVQSFEQMILVNKHERDEGDENALPY